MVSQWRTVVIVIILSSEIASISLMDAYRSDKAVRRRQGQGNVRFRPLAHLRGNDDWRNQIGYETLTDQIMDENGVVYDINPTANDRLTRFFNTYNTRSRIG